MPIIKGNHGKVSASVQADSPFESIPAGVDPRQAFNYLTFDPNALTSASIESGFLPNTSAVVIDLLKQLGAAMIDQSTRDDDAGDSTIPPIYTYWGQFIDHDITAGTDRPAAEVTGQLQADILQTDFTPFAPLNVTGEQGIFNLRLPLLDLDSVYGGGPDDPDTIAEQIFLKDVPNSGAAANDPRLALGTNSDVGGPVTHANLPDPLRRDLPRHPDRSPRIGDARNDENTIIAQFHTAFLRFHNSVVDELEARNGTMPSFDEVAQLVRWHYQWLVVNDFLRAICVTEIVDELVAAESHFFSDREALFMPLEFSTAAFRFGHSMVRAQYNFNEIFNPASFDLLFEFTGSGGFFGNPTLPNNWIIDWERFTGLDVQRARTIDTNLALPLRNLPGGMVELEKHLAQRNLLRGYLLSIPTAQFTAEQLGVAPLSGDDLVASGLEEVFGEQDGLLKTHTPLWYYVLREAQVQQDGNKLGELGSRLVAGTLISLLKADPDSYLNNGWTPSSEGAMRSEDRPIENISLFLQFANVTPVQHRVMMPIIGN